MIKPPLHSVPAANKMAAKPCSRELTCVEIVNIPVHSSITMLKKDEDLSE